MKNAQLYTSNSEHWCTPPELIAILKGLSDIGLDPCSNDSSIVGAKTEFSRKEDGLSRSWVGHGLVYVNPPYGRVISSWTKKMYEEAEKGAEIIALLPAKTDTRWFHDYVLKSDKLFFFKGRLKFLDYLTGEPVNSATFPSLLAYYGPRPMQFQQALSTPYSYPGWFVVP